MSAALDPEAVDAALNEVLAEPPFDGASGGAAALWRRVFEMFRRWYDDTVTDLYFNDPAIFWALSAVLLGTLVLLVIHMSVSMRDVVRAIRRHGPVLVEQAASPASRGLDDARDAVARGELRLAVELAWSVSVTLLRGGRAPTGGERTPRQIYRELAVDLPAAELSLLEDLMAAHERACYGGVPATAATAEHALRVAERLVSGRGAPAGRGA